MRPSKQLWIDKNACFLRLPPLELVALCVYGEARGESIEGQTAVMNVIRNRMRHFGRYCDKDIQRCGLGKEFHCIILKKWQFSCFNLGDPNRQKLLNMACDVQREVRENKRVASTYALSMLFNDVQDNTDGATLYHYNGMATFPAWTLSDKVTMTKEIGDHIFYREK